MRRWRSAERCTGQLAIDFHWIIQEYGYSFDNIPLHLVVIKTVDQTSRKHIQLSIDTVHKTKYTVNSIFPGRLSVHVFFSTHLLSKKSQRFT